MSLIAAGPIHMAAESERAIITRHATAYLYVLDVAIVMANAIANVVPIKRIGRRPNFRDKGIQMKGATAGTIEALDPMYVAFRGVE